MEQETDDTNSHNGIRDNFLEWTFALDFEIGQYFHLRIMWEKSKEGESM